jgi:hypothetical protein
MDKLSLVAFLVVFVGLLTLVASSRAALRRLGGLAVTLGLAGAAQWQMLDGRFLQGGLLYTAAAGSLLLCMRLSRTDFAALVAWERWSIWQEGAALAAVLGVATLLRLWRFGNVPYGIEQDEGLWTWEIAHQFFSHLRPGFTEYHFTSFPVGFSEGGIFLRLFGLHMLSVRLEVLFFSLLATVLFYLLVRGLISVPVAVIATFFLGISVIDISASRVALFEVRVKFWVIASYFLFFWGLRRNDVLLFLLTGGALAGGMLVYQTFFLTPLVVVLTLFVVALRERYRWREHGLALLAITAPLPLAAGRVWNFVQAQRGFTSREWVSFTSLHPYDSAFEKFIRMWQFAGENFGEIAQSLFFRQRWGDFIIIRSEGPIVLAAVIPLSILGLVIALLNLRKSAYAFVLLWLLIGFFVAPLSTGTNYVRIVYPGLPAVYVLAAIGAFFVVKAVYRNAGLVRGYMYFGVLVLFAALLTGVSWRIYFHEVADPLDRQQRREMLDTVSSAADIAPMVFLPYVPAHGDTLDVEVDGVRFEVGHRWGLRNAEEHYQLVSYDSLLASIAKEPLSDPLAIVYHKTLGAERELRESAMEAVAGCYPDREVEIGSFFDLITISPDQLAASRCYSIAGVTAQSPAGSLPPSPAGEVAFRWGGAQGKQRSFRLVLERARDGVQLLEAEDVLAGPAWYEDLRFGPGHSGRSFLIDNWQAGRAQGVVVVPEEGRYQLWVRFNQRALTDAQAFFYVDGQGTPFGAAGPEELDKWVWKSVGSYDLTAGEHTLGVQKFYGRDPHNGLFLDSIIISSDEGFDPNRDDLWQEVFDSRETESSESEFVLSAAAPDCAVCGPEGLAPGRYRWRVQVFDGERLVDAVGNRGVWSDYAEFLVEPSSVSSVPGP